MRLANERGIAPPLFVGLDRAEERLRRARAEHTPGLFLCGDATELPVHSGSVDAVLSFTVMSSLPLAVRSLAAQEMVRVLRPRGIIVWYDYRHRRTGTADPPWGLTREDVQALFPRAHVDVRRAVAPVRVAEACLRAWLSPRLVELVPFLTSHLSGVIRV
jgi:ubiquinone/menaquinone biosynthesis C-methylase UbiE